MSRRWIGRAIVASLWLAGMLAAGLLWKSSGVPLAELPAKLASWLEEFGRWNAVALYLVFYLARPLIFFPSSILGIAAGVLFGPWLGTLVVIVGENLGATVAFLLARYFGRGWVVDHEGTRMAKWDQRLRERGATSVLILRLLWLPFDSVSYACGLTSMRHWQFAIGTLVGSLPTVLSLSFFGGSASAGSTESVTILGVTASARIFLVALSAALLVLALGLAYVVSRLRPERA